MARINFSVIEKQLGYKLDLGEKEPTNEEWWNNLKRRNNETELSRCNRVSVEIVSALKKCNYHGKTYEEFQQFVEQFKKEFDKAIKEDPIIGD